MKRSKKLLICAAACVTAVSVAGLTACTDNTPSDKLSADVKVAEVMSSEDLTAQIARFESVNSTSFSVEGGLKVVKLEGGEIPGGVSIAEISARGNLDDGDADILLSLNSGLFGSEAPGQGGTTVMAEGEEAGVTMVDMNVYLRDWKAFYPNTEGEEGFEYEDLAALISNSANVVMSDVLAMAGQGFLQDNEKLLKLANTTDSIIVSESEHTITLNVNKMVYGLYDYIRQIVNNITADTSLSGLMQCSAVKYYVEAFTADMSAQDLYDAFMEIIAGGGNAPGSPFALLDVAGNSPLAVIQPLPNEGVYNYIVRLLNSEDLAALIGSEKPLGATKIVDLMGEDAASALNMLKASVNSLLGNVITEDSIIIPPSGSTEDSFAGMTVSNLTLVYAFNAQDKLQSVSFKGNIETDLDGAVEMELSLTAALLSEKVTDLTDIGGEVVIVRDEFGEISGKTTVGAILAPAA